MSSLGIRVAELNTTSLMQLFGSVKAPYSTVSAAGRLVYFPAFFFLFFWVLVNQRGGRVNAPIGGRFECSDAQFQAEALYAGLGIGLRLADEVRRAEVAGTLERVLPRWSLEPFSVWVVSPKGRLKVPRVAAVADLLKRIIGRLGEV